MFSREVKGTSPNKPKMNWWDYWILFDGPDGINQYEGVANSLGCAMEQVITKRIENARFYKG